MAFWREAARIGGKWGAPAVAGGAFSYNVADRWNKSGIPGAPDRPVAALLGALLATVPYGSARARRALGIGWNRPVRSALTAAYLSGVAPTLASSIITHAPRIPERVTGLVDNIDQVSALVRKAVDEVGGSPTAAVGKFVGGMMHDSGMGKPIKEVGGQLSDALRDTGIDLAGSTVGAYLGGALGDWFGKRMDGEEKKFYTEDEVNKRNRKRIIGQLVGAALGTVGGYYGAQLFKPTAATGKQKIEQ